LVGEKPIPPSNENVSTAVNFVAGNPGIWTQEFVSEHKIRPKEPPDSSRSSLPTRHDVVCVDKVHPGHALGIDLLEIVLVHKLIEIRARIDCLDVLSVLGQV
jgi:hypothetical protein